MKKNYETPNVEIIEVTVEQGFAASKQIIDIEDGGLGL